MKILIVEDNELLGSAFVDALTYKGFDTAWAKTGKQCKEALQVGSFDVILLDYNLPDATADTLIGPIKDISDAEIVISSGDLNSCKLTKHSLYKPFSIQELVEMLKQFE